MSTREKSTCLCSLSVVERSLPSPRPHLHQVPFHVVIEYQIQEKSIDFGVHPNAAFQLFRILLDILSRMIRPLNRNLAESWYIVPSKQCRTRSAGFWWSQLIRIHTVLQAGRGDKCNKSNYHVDWLGNGRKCYKISLVSRTQVKKEYRKQYWSCSADFVIFPVYLVFINRAHKLLFE